MGRVLVVMVLAVAVLAPMPSRGAQEQPGVLLIMDASGSMNRDSGSGASLIEEAKLALRELVDRLPADARVGLRVYGAHASSDSPKAVGCADSELVIPVGPIDRTTMLQAIDDYVASGWTPIGSSLQLAVEDLGPAGGTIILVSDGEDTCAPPDPCEVAQQLAGAGYITAIHTVGLALQDQAAADQLQCVADVSGGTFTDVTNVDFLLESLSGVVTGAIEGPEMPYVLGSLVRETAPVLRLHVWDENNGWLVAGAESAIQTGETRWMAVDVDEEGLQLAATANIDWQPEAGPDEYLEIQIFDETGVEIGQAHEVLGVIVERPARLPLIDAAEYALNQDWTPSVQAVTDPRSMFPAWEGSEDWFRLTVDRFAAAGLNGGMYELWKSETFPDTLPPGRYFVAVTWVSDRSDVSRMETHVDAYPVYRDRVWGTDWRRTGDVVIDTGLAGASRFELTPWTGEPRSGPFDDPIRSGEVWTVIEPGVPREYVVELAEGEVALVGWHVEWAQWQQQESRFDLSVTHEEGDPQVGEIPYGSSGVVGYGDGAIEGFPEGETFVARWDGDYVLTAALTGNAGLEPAMSLTVFVFTAFPESGFNPDVLFESAWQAMMSGLEAVRNLVNG